MTRIEVPNSSRRGGTPRRFLRWFLLLMVLIVVGAGLWTWLTLAWAYSDGERAGVLQKFARKGWVCKTEEGEIALYYGGGQYLGPGSTPPMWDFSVRDKAVAAQLDKAVGHRVQLHFTEHPGIPSSCFAETRFFVDRVTDEQMTNPPASPTPGSPSPTAEPPSAPDVRPGATLSAPPPPKP
jgi:hypothetical protein